MSSVENTDDDDGTVFEPYEPGLDTMERSERSLLVFFGVLACFVGLALIILEFPLLPLFFRLMFGLLLLAVGTYNMLLGIQLVDPPRSSNSNRARLVVGERLLVGLFATTVMIGGAMVLVADGRLLFRLLLSVPAFAVGGMCVLIASGAVTPPDTTSDDYRQVMRQVDARQHGRAVDRDLGIPEPKPLKRRRLRR